MSVTFKSIALTAFLWIAITFTMQAQTVYVTESGKKYHAKNCDVAKTGKKGITLSEATKAGYTPCKVCKADAIKSEDKKTSTKKTPAKTK